MENELIEDEPHGINPLWVVIGIVIAVIILLLFS